MVLDDVTVGQRHLAAAKVTTDGFVDGVVFLFWAVLLSLWRQNARVHRGAREDGPADPRTRQEEQPVGREGQMRHHVKTTVAIFTVSLSFSVCICLSVSLSLSLFHFSDSFLPPRPLPRPAPSTPSGGRPNGSFSSILFFVSSTQSRFRFVLMASCVFCLFFFSFRRSSSSHFHRFLNLLPIHCETISDHVVVQ